MKTKTLTSSFFTVISLVLATTSLLFAQLPLKTISHHLVNDRSVETTTIHINPSTNRDSLLFLANSLQAEGVQLRVDQTEYSSTGELVRLNLIIVLPNGLKKRVYADKLNFLNLAYSKSNSESTYQFEPVRTAAAGYLEVN